VLQLTSSPSNAKTPLEGSEFTLKFFLAWLRANSAVTKAISTCPSSKFISRFSCVGSGERSPTSLRTELETGRAGGCGLATTMSLSSMISIPLSGHFVFKTVYSISIQQLTLGCVAQIHLRLRVSLVLLLSFPQPLAQGQQLSLSHQWRSSISDKRSQEGTRNEVDLIRFMYSPRASFFRLLAMYSLQRPPKSVVWVALFRQLKNSTAELDSCGLLCTRGPTGARAAKSNSKSCLFTVNSKH
jgi:hypothetical protein